MDHRLALLALLIAGAATAQQPEWTQWRGPDRNGISKETGWREAGDEVLWSKRVGLGYSTVSIAEGRLYTVGHDKEAEKDTIFCLESLTGKEVWSHTFPAKTMAMAHGGGSLSTPSIDGERVFVTSREGPAFGFDAKTGKVLWQWNAVEKLDAEIPKWGFSASPLVLEDHIVLNFGRVVAVDRKGKVLWKTKDYGHAYSTPADFTRNGEQYLAVFNGSGLAVLQRKTGKEVATSTWKTMYDVNAATPVVIGDKIFISSGYNAGCAMLEFDGKKLKTLWEGKEMRNHMSGCVHFDGHLYGFDESLLKCLDLDGNVKWTQRGLGKGALLLADGKILALTNRGDLVVAKAASDEFKELSRVRVLDEGGAKWTTPVLCGGLVYCRSSEGQLVCVDRRPKAAAGNK